MTIVIDPTESPAGGTTLDDLVARVRRELNDRDNLNILDAAVDETTTSLSFRYPLSATSRGSKVSIDNEEMYVWDADNTAQTVEVERAYGSEADAHDAGERVIVGGKSRLQIVDALNDELSSCSARGLYYMRSVTVTDYSPATFSYYLAQIEGSNVYDVQYLPTTETTGWVHIPGWQYSPADGAVTFSSPVVSSIRVLYKASFGSLINGEDDLQNTTGLHNEAADVLVWGACARLTTSEDWKRNNIHTQGDTRRPGEVPARALSGSSRDFAMLRDQRLNEEKDRLRRHFPIRNARW